MFKHCGIQIINRVLPWPPAQQTLPYNNYANKNQLKWNPQ